MNYRPEYRHGWGGKTSTPNYGSIRWGREEAQALLTALLGAAAALQPFHSLPSWQKRSGNPFFMEEMVQTLVDQEVLRRDPAGGMHLVAPVTSGALAALLLPPTVQGVLAARIDRLPADVKTLLQTLAVLGKEFAWSLLTAVADQPEDELQRLLAHLQAEEFLYEQPAFPGSAYTFKHALTQEVAYNAVLLERRRVLHERAAQAIEGLFPERLAEHYNALAHHYSRSGNTTRAVDYLQRAGQQAVERSAYAEAVSHLTTALDLLTTLPETRARSQQELAVQMTLGIALRATRGAGGGPEVERLYTRARELCERVGEPPQLFRVLWGLWNVYNLRGEYQTQRALGEQLLSLAERLQDPGLLLEAHHALWTTLFRGGELAAARPHLEQGMKLYDPQRHRTHAAIYSGHDPGVCCRIAGCSVPLAPRVPRPGSGQHPGGAGPGPAARPSLESGPRPVLGCRASSLSSGGAPTQARAEAVMTIATDQGFQGPLARAMPLRGWARAACGHGEEGIMQIQQGWPPTRR